MANWRQIQGRIRRARTSADPLAKLSELFQKTHDAMVAFEAATLEEKAGRNDEAIRWYTAAAERFRRADWRRKASEALTRLGAPVPQPASSSSSSAVSGDAEAVGSMAASADERETSAAPAAADILADSEIAPQAASPATNEDTGSARPVERHGRRRGRRGGRRHKHRGANAAPSASPTKPLPARVHVQHLDESVFTEPTRPAPATVSPSTTARFVAEPTGGFVERSTYIRAGDPALASRFAYLESLLRRLISAPLHRVDQLDEAPAGPGVFLLSDSDLMTNYYVEACQTLRIGTGQLARAGRAGRGARAEGKASLRAQLAEHLEINDTQVTGYLGKHCVVRWLQLDEDAPHLAHFAIAVLRPALNAD